VTCDPPAELYHSADLRVTCDMPEISADTEFFFVNFIYFTLDLQLNEADGDDCVPKQ
jgi:hypothetical protein